MSFGERLGFLSRRSLPVMWFAVLAATPASSDEHGTWTAVPPPNGRISPSFLHDPVTDRFVLWAGDEGLTRNDAWTLEDAAGWERMTPAGTPPPGRTIHVTVHDPVRNRMIVFGGVLDGTLINPTLLNDVWALTLGASPAWTEILPAGAPPTARTQHAAVYDGARDRVLIVGGDDGTFRNDVWELSLSGGEAWTEILPAGPSPSPRRKHVCILDAAGDRLLLFGGDDGAIRGDLWALSLSGTPTWSQLTTMSSPPGPRAFPAAIHDAAGGRWVLFGGWDGTTFLDETWTLDLTDPPVWSQLTPASPPSGRWFHAGAYDGSTRRFVVLGGGDNGFDLPVGVSALPLAAPTAWTEIVPESAAPPGRMAHSAVHDPVRDRMVVFAGAGPSPSDVWALSLADSPQWTDLAPQGPAPSDRRDHAAVYDPLRDRMLVYGGALSSEVWELSLDAAPRWTQVFPTGTPPVGRESHTAVYDPARDRVVVFGGFDGTGFRGDVHALSLTPAPAWTELTSSGTPPSLRRDHVAVADPTGDRMIVYGGWGGAGFLNDVWELSFDTLAWSEILPSGPLPEAAVTHAGVWDSVRDRFVTFGGSYHSEVWELTFAGGPVWRQLSPTGVLPTGRVDHTIVADAARDRMITFGGHSGLTLLRDTWILTWGDAVVAASGTGEPAGLSLACLPNPTGGRAAISFALPRPGPARITVHDVRGRLVTTLVDRPVGRGRRTTGWSAPAGIPAGTYFVVLDAGGSRLTRKLTLVR